MQVVIVGGGRTGKGLAKRLIDDHSPVIVEIDEDRAVELQSDLDVLVVNGDGSNYDVLAEAGVEEADAVVALTASDEVNVMVCKLAKDFGVPRIVTRINQIQNRGMAEDVGADVEINIVSENIGLFQKAVTESEIYGILSMGGEMADVLEARVSEGSRAEGKTIEELDLPDLVSVAVVTREGELLAARGETRLERRDRVILAGEPELVFSVAKDYFGKK